MKPIAKIECVINNIYYEPGEEIEPKNINQLIILNEKGFIEPLTMKQMQDYFKKSEIKPILKKEEE